MKFNFSEIVDSSPSLRLAKRHWLTVAFCFGFLVDTLTLNNVEQLFDNIILFSYVMLAMFSLFMLYAGVAERLPERIVHYAREYAPLLVQFSFGGLLSGMLIFYGRSGAWIESWPFLLVILAVIFGNETIRNRSNRFIFNISIFFIGLMSYVVLVVPVFVGYMGAWIFLLSGVIALSVVILFLKLLKLVIPRFMELQKKTLIFTLGMIYLGFNALYFLNIIPPIPLSLKDLGIYHSAVRFDSGEYQLTYEKGPWWQFLQDSNSTFRPRESDGVFCFAQVFAPTRLGTDIYHKWEFKNPETGDWETHTRISYSISGGRNEGFRGYTLISNYRDGTWRCTVETERGQVLGYEVFKIDSTEKPGEMVTITK